MVMYVDDTNIFFDRSELSLELKLNNYLDRLDEWLISSKVQVNAAKTEYIIFRPINKPQGSFELIRLYNMYLEQVKEQILFHAWFGEELR